MGGGLPGGAAASKAFFSVHFYVHLRDPFLSVTACVCVCVGAVMYTKDFFVLWWGLWGGGHC